jgi:hypothetical protein
MHSNLLQFKESVSRVLRGVLTPDKPPVWRMVLMRERRLVKILCTYAWWPTSYMILSSGELKTCAPQASHIRRPAARKPFPPHHLKTCSALKHMPPVSFRKGGWAQLLLY